MLKDKATVDVNVELLDMSKDKAANDMNAEFIQPQSYPSSRTNILAVDKGNPKTSEMNPATRRPWWDFCGAMSFAESVARFKIRTWESISGTANIDPLS